MSASMSAPTASRTSKSAANSETPRTIKAGRVVDPDPVAADRTATTTPKTKPAKPGKSEAAKASATKPAAATAKPSTKSGTDRNKAPKRAADSPTKSTKKSAAAELDASSARAGKHARNAERLAKAEAELAREEEKSGLGTTTQWLLAAVLGVLVFQIVHSAEHVAQATSWLFNPTVAPWMSMWAMALANGLATVSGGTPALGMELLHLIGNAVFLGGLLLAFRMPAEFTNPQMLRWLRIATIVEALHFAEHVLLTVSVALAGNAIGLSTMFGLLSTGTPAASGYRVFFHLVVNMVALVFAVKAVLAVRDERLATAGRTPTGFDWKRMALLAAPVAGLLFLLPIFGGHVVTKAAGDNLAVATVNGVQITNGDLQAEVDAVAGQQAALALDPATVAATGVESEGLQNTDPDQLQFAVLNSLVQAAIIEQGAEAMGVAVTDADVEARRTQLIEENFLGQANYDKFLADSNVDAGYADEQIRKLLFEECVQQQLTAGFAAPAETVQAEFEAKYEGFPQARHLLTTSRDQAEVYLAQVKGGADFDEMIRTLSDDPRAATQGGEMGTIREGAQVPEVVEVVYGLQDGQYGIVQTQFGWHVIQRLAPPSLADVEPEIREGQLLVQMGEAGQAWIKELRAAAEVSLVDGFGVWDTQFGAVVAPPQDATASPTASHHG